MTRTADDALHRVFKKTRNTGYSIAFPWLVTLVPRLSGWEVILNSFQTLVSTMVKTVEEHKSSIRDGEPRDFIDICLEEIKCTMDPKSAFYGKQSGNLNSS